MLSKTAQLRGFKEQCSCTAESERETGPVRWDWKDRQGWHYEACRTGSIDSILDGDREQLWRTRKKGVTQLCLCLWKTTVSRCREKTEGEQYQKDTSGLLTGRNKSKRRKDLKEMKKNDSLGQSYCKIARVISGHNENQR